MINGIDYLCVRSTYYSYRDENRYLLCCSSTITDTTCSSWWYTPIMHLPQNTQHILYV